MPARDVPALELRSLTKRFSRPAVDRLDLSIAAGEFYALLGPNGAGKTTTLRLVAGLIPPDGGDIRVFGIDARRSPIEAKRIVAWLPDEPMLYDKLDPLEYLEFVAGLWSSPGPSARCTAMAAPIMARPTRSVLSGKGSRPLCSPGVLCVSILLNNLGYSARN
jgi:ABC-2 type transport system ATP-binding protein